MKLFQKALKEGIRIDIILKHHYICKEPVKVRMSRSR